MSGKGTGVFGWHLTGHDDQCPVTTVSGIRCKHPMHEQPGEEVSDGPREDESS